MWICNLIEDANTFCSIINEEFSLDSLVTVEDIKVLCLSPVTLGCDIRNDYDVSRVIYILRDNVVTIDMKLTISCNGNNGNKK